MCLSGTSLTQFFTTNIRFLCFMLVRTAVLLSKSSSWTLCSVGLILSLSFCLLFKMHYGGWSPQYHYPLKPCKNKPRLFKREENQHGAMPAAAPVGAIFICFTVSYLIWLIFHLCSWACSLKIYRRENTYLLNCWGVS